MFEIESLHIRGLSKGVGILQRAYFDSKLKTATDANMLAMTLSTMASENAIILEITKK